MTQSERDALNAEYAATCKGDTYKLMPWHGGGLDADFLSDEADAWRRVKALAKQSTSPVEITYSEKMEENTMRACIALKVRVP